MHCPSTSSSLLKLVMTSSCRSLRDACELLLVGNIYFVTKPKNETVAEGSRVRLPCRAEGYPENITYRWYRDGVDVQLIPGLMQVRRRRVEFSESCT